MYNDPRLLTPVVTALIAGVLLLTAWKAPLPYQLEWLRMYLWLFGLVFLAVALVTGVEYVVWRFSLIRELWYSSRLDMLHTIQKMTPDQISLALSMGVVLRYKAKLAGELVPMYTTPWGEDIPIQWIIDYLEECEKSYPKLRPINRNSDGSIERTYNEQFTRWMAAWGLITESAGNQPARWLVPLERVYERLHLTEEG